MKQLGKRLWGNSFEDPDVLIPLVIVPSGDTLVYEMGDAQISSVF